MLFYSSEFLFLFLPITIFGYFIFWRMGSQVALGWLGGASLFFYGWWEPRYIVLIIVSIFFNYVGGILLSHTGSKICQRCVLIFFVCCNILLLLYYKYLFFFWEQFNAIWETGFTISPILLPIGVSFYTFTQIAYLVDVSINKKCEIKLVNYVLFVTYFPHLVAGPILHHSEMMPQFESTKISKFSFENMAKGVTFFTCGLFKKIIFADGCAPIANNVFDSAKTGSVSFGDAWIGAVAYTLQIYYDFSGYCDMAIGLSLMFNLYLPINFYSPYQATSIIDFWRRWHITLSRFLRDYLYIPLGGNRQCVSRQSCNLLVTMLLGGLWHGANWTFLLWGGVHGVYLIINHGWRVFCKIFLVAKQERVFVKVCYWGLTFVGIIFGWVIFRSDNIFVALTMLKAMLFSMPETLTAEFTIARAGKFLLLLLWTLIMPNTSRIFDYYFGSKLKKEPAAFHFGQHFLWAILTGTGLFVVAIVGLTGRKSLEFLYFQF